MSRRIGKYRIQKKIASGGFATVYKAMDTVEGVPVALKIPHVDFQSPARVVEFRREIRLAAALDHPHILPLKNAEVYDGQLVVAFRLGDESLAQRLRRRVSTAKALDWAGQMIEALAYAHSHRIIHCDVKPENLILFGDELRLTDFGIARVALRTMSASGSGTIGYVAPEQAMGKPSFRSDVFSAGLVIYRMLAGHVPSWPFRWPPPRLARVRKKVPPAFIEFLRKSLRVDHRKRYEDAAAMAAAFDRMQPAIQRFRRRGR
ncbi:MAG: serine/threonine protein kinase [Planctomycetota bacterium]|nr:serine/threonine protein kinase [Planctomycetota bacterium]